MMSISASLADLNHQRFQDWTTPFTPDNARPAVLAFDGDTYTGLDAARSFSERDYTHSQKVLRILSGLHGCPASTRPHSAVPARDGIQTHA